MRGCCAGVSLWVYGGVGTQVCDNEYVGMWVSACVHVRVCGCLVVWVSACVGERVRL